MNFFLNTDTNINKHRVFLTLIFMLSILNLTGCWQVNVIKPGIETNSISKPNTEIQSDDLRQINSNVKKSNKNIKEFANKFINKPLTTTNSFVVANDSNPINYPTDKWNEEEVSPLTIQDVSENPNIISEVISVDNNSLDFTSNTAIKYRYMQNNQPYLDLVDSTDYLELGWHFANESDSDEVKEVSKNHAHKAHRLARQLMGDQGGRIIEDILHGQVIKDQQVENIEISLAKCEFYSCMFVMKQSILGEMHRSEEQDNDQESLEKINEHKSENMHNANVDN